MGFTQTALAERIGIAQSHYGQIELGKTRAKPETRRWMDGAGEYTRLGWCRGGSSRGSEFLPT